MATSKIPIVSAINFRNVIIALNNKTTITYTLTKVDLLQQLGITADRLVTISAFARLQGRLYPITISDGGNNISVTKDHASDGGVNFPISLMVAYTDMGF